MSQIEVKDNEATLLQRALGFFLKHTELLKQSLQEGDFHTADFLCMQLEGALTTVHRIVREQLRKSSQVSYTWEINQK